MTERLGRGGVHRLYTSTGLRWVACSADCPCHDRPKALDPKVRAMLERTGIDEKS